MNIGKYGELFSNEMKLMNFSFNTIKSYGNCINTFLNLASNKFDQPKDISEEDIKKFLLWIQKKSSVAYQRQMTSSIKLFYAKVIKQPQKLIQLQYPKTEQKLPEILSKNEVQNLLSAAKNNIKHQAIIALLYSCGLRISEVLNLKIVDIDSQRMIIRIIESKGNKSRQVNLNDNVLNLLRKYFTLYKPTEYLFNLIGSTNFSFQRSASFLTIVSFLTTIQTP